MSKILKVVGASWLQTKISSYVLGILGILAILALFVGQIERIQEDGNYAATVFYSEKTGYRIEYWGQSNELADIPKGVARAYFRMDIETTGWSLLEVETDASYPDDIQAYAAGIVEGALTWSLIHTHLENTIRARCELTPLEKQCNKLRDTLDKSVDTWKSYAADRGTEPFWHQVSLYYIQISGIFTGWKHGVERSQNEYDTDISDLYWLNSIGETTEIQMKLNLTVNDDVIDTLPDLSSAFLRIVNETAEDGSTTKKLYFAQNSAGNYSTMTRILKRYKLNYHETSKNTSSIVPGLSVEFSGYPGSITSQDEIYVIKGKEHRLAVSGTPLKNYNSELWKDVNITHHVPLGPRIIAANHLATNVSAWGHTIASSNSGTGCKQWLVVNFEKLDDVHEITPEQHLSKHSNNDIISESTVIRDVKHTVIHTGSNSHNKGLALLIEQVPGRTHSADLSDVLLNQGYWATFGLPFFNDIAETTQTDKMRGTYGNVFSETESPRAVLFKRGFKNATSLESIIKLMRQNNVTAMNRASNETHCERSLDCMLDEQGYWSVLGVRGDMVQNNREAYGIIDTKVVIGYKKAPLEFIALSGPTYTKANVTKVNKGNIAPLYTHQFDNNPSIDGLEIRDLVKQQLEEAEQENLEYLNRDVIKPFQWSESEYKNIKHQGLPDTWAFEPFVPKWSW